MSSQIVKQPPYEQNESDETSSFSEESGTYSSITGKSRLHDMWKMIKKQGLVDL